MFGLPKGGAIRQADLPLPQGRGIGHTGGVAAGLAIGQRQELQNFHDLEPGLAGVARGELLPPGVNLIDLVFDPIRQGPGFHHVPAAADGHLVPVQCDPFALGDFEHQDVVGCVVIPAPQFGVQVGQGRSDVGLKGADGMQHLLEGVAAGAKDFQILNPVHQHGLSS